MKTVTEDIKDRLVSFGVGIFASVSEDVWGIFIGEEPERLRKTITLYDTGGQQPAHTLNTRRPMEYPTYQIRVRGTTYLEAHNKIEECINALERKGSWEGTTDSSENTIRYSDTYRTSNPLYLKKDENGNYIWVVNMIAFRQERNY